MLCKEEVCLWFRNLSGPKRIELLSGLLQISLPLEVRYIGSIVEDLARKNYHYLREAEIRANDLNEIKTLVDMLDDFTRSKLNIYLTLLHSTNTVCSNVLYSTLICLEPLHQWSMLNLPNEVKERLTEEVLLLYTMAARHPAFTFSQRQVLCEKLQTVQQILEYAKDDTCDSTSSANHSVSNSPASATVTKQLNPGQSTKVYVENIEVTGYQKTPDKRNEFHLKVTWSDGEVTETYKTYQALHSFNAEMAKLFPLESSVHKQDRLIPSFPSEREPGQGTHSQKELADLIHKYLKELTALPDNIVHSSHLTTFLQNKVCEKEFRSPLTVKDVEDEPVSPNVHKGSRTIYNSNITEARRPSPDQHARSPGRPQVPTASFVTAHSNQRHVYSNPGSSPSPFSSPMQSPLSSPHVSPSTSHYSSRSASPWSTSTGKFEVSAWLKQARLHKYRDLLDRYTQEELLKLSNDDLDNLGFTLGARNKLRTLIEKLRTEMKNGLVTSASSLGSRATSPGSPWHSPPHGSVQLSPPSSSSQPPIVEASTEDHYNGSKQHHAISFNHVDSKGYGGSMENSPECSENCSPPPSPGPQHQKYQRSDCPLMDEVDRENEREPIQGKEEEKEPFQSNIPQGAIVESRPQVSPLYPKQEGNHNNNAFMSAGAAIDMKPPHVMEGLPAPYPPGMPRPMMHVDPQQQMQMFLMHRPNLRSQHPPIKPPLGSSAVMGSPKLPNINGGSMMYENGTILQVTKVSGHEPLSSNAQAIAVSMSALTTVDAPPTYNKPVMGFPMPGSIVSNQAGNGAMSAARPVTLALPLPTVCNSTVTYSVAPVTSIASMDIGKANTGPTVPPLHTLISTTGVDSNAYIAYHSVHSGSGNLSFQGQGGPVSATPAQTPGPTPTHAPAAPLQSVGPNVSTTPLQTPVTGVTHVPAPVHSVVSQATQPLSQPAPSCSSCGCNGHCTGAASAYGQVMWHQHPLMPASYPVGLMPVTSNGPVPTNLPYSHPLQPVNLPNGINPDVVYNNQPHNINFLQQSENPSNVFVTSANSGISSSVPPSHVVPRKGLQCYNCGEAGHRAMDCRELTMESLTHNGYHLNICPKSDSE